MSTHDDEALRTAMTLLSLMRSVSNQFRQMEDEGELTLTDLTVLAAIGRGVDLPSNLARRLRLDFARISRISDHLHALGYIERETDPSDRRRSRLRLTESGRLRLARGQADLATVMDGIAEGLTPDEQQGLEAAIDGIRRVLRARVEGEPEASPAP